MTKKMNNQASRLFLILFASFFLISMIPMGMMGYTWLRADESVMSQMDVSNQALIGQMQAAIDNRVQEVQNIYSQIYSNQQMQTLMYTSSGFSGNNIIRSLELINNMNMYCNISDFVDDVFVYFSGMDMVVTQYTTARPDMFYTVKFGKQMEYSVYMDILYNPHHAGTLYLISTADGTRYGGFCYSMPVGKNGTTLGTICLMIREDKLLSLIEPISQAFPGGAAFVKMRDGKVMTSSTMLSGEDVPQHIELVSPETIGQFKQDRSTTVRLEAGEHGLQYQLTAVVDRAEIFGSALQLRETFLIAIGISFVLTLLGAMALTIQTYKPLREIARQVDTAQVPREEGGKSNPLAMMESGVREISNQNRQLREIADRSRQVLRISFVNQLLSGVYRLSAEEFARDCEKFQVELNQAYFCVLVIHVDLKQIKTENAEENEQRQAWYILTDIVECFDDHDVSNVTSVANYDHNCLFVILGGETPEALDVQGTAQRIKLMIEQGYPAFATIGVGTVERGYASIPDSRINAQYALDYRMVTGISSIIDYASVPKGDNDSVYYEYISEGDNRLITYARAGNEQEAVKLIDEMFDRYLDHLPTQMIRCLVYDMTISVFRLISSLNIPADTIFGDGDPVEYLGGCETIDTTRMRFKDVYRTICQTVDSKKRSHNTSLRQDVEEFIRQHYADENLSQQMIADEFGRSANYLSYFFREQTGEKMSSYISSVRIEQAERLLRETDMSVKDIAQQTGFGSDLNFIRVFKKMRGITPGKYRKGDEAGEIDEK